jgi:ureidoglycolate lyase
MNEARFRRFDDLCDIDMGGGDVAISIARCRAPTTLPLRIDMVERHPLGSQAFVPLKPCRMVIVVAPPGESVEASPLKPCRMVIVVAPPGESVEASDLRAFVTNGKQGINYHRGTWHMPLIAFDAGQDFLIVDRRGGKESNCETHMLDDVVMLETV